MERAMLAEEPSLSITGVDLGSGQIARARKKNPEARVTYVLGDAARTEMPDGSFDRVLIGLALHEMPRSTRLAVLREARRLCARGGHVLAIEHGRPLNRASRFVRGLWWFFWIPGNPEVPTSRDAEMRECGLGVIERHTTRPDWIEALLSTPNAQAAPPPPKLSPPESR
jgi:ubiquinone/menaquinone biosynthesis C-methylase UbiE